MSASTTRVAEAAEPRLTEPKHDSAEDSTIPTPVDGVADAGEPPDGGLHAWLSVAGCFALYFNHLGLINSWGAFQSYYETTLLSTLSPSTISWIGSVQVFCFMTIAVIIGPLFDMGYCRTLIVVGAALETAGWMLTSVGSQYWHILLAQGICLGLGTCCISIPSMAVVPLYFKKRRAFAMALACTGSGFGSTSYPLMFNALRARLGFGWAVRIMGFVCLGFNLFALIAIRPRAKPGPRRTWQNGGLSWRSFIDTAAFKERTYLIYCVGVFFNNLAFFGPSYFLQSYALSHGMSGHHLAAYLLSIANSSSIPGRIIPSYLADKVGVLDTFIFVSAMSGAIVFYWTSVVNVAGNVSFAVLWGFWSGGVVALMNVVLTTITADLSRLGTRLGMVSILKGVASLVGPPISGAILSTTGSYLGVQLFSGFGMILTALPMLALRIVIVRRELDKQRDVETTSDGQGQDGGREGPHTGTSVNEKQ